MKNFSYSVHRLALSDRLEGIRDESRNRPKNALGQRWERSILRGNESRVGETVRGRSTSKVQKAAPLSRVTGRFRRPSFCKLGAREFSAKKRVINDRRCLKSSPRALSLFHLWRSSLTRIEEFLTSCTLVIDSGLLVAEKRQRDYYEGR